MVFKVCHDGIQSFTLITSSIRKKTRKPASSRNGPKNNIFLADLCNLWSMKINYNKFNKLPAEKIYIAQY